MENLTFCNVKLPEALCREIRRLSLKHVGKYNWMEHRFLPPYLDPRENDMRQIQDECAGYGSLEKINCRDLVQYVLENTNITPITKDVDSICVATGNTSAIKKLQHVILSESKGSQTELLYLEKNRFLVLRTTRSTILAGDILQANKLPIKIGECAEFTIFRDGKEFVPDMFSAYTTSFQMQSISQIILKSSPELYEIIDEDERYGGVLLKDKGRQTEKKVLSLMQDIASRIEKSGNDNLSLRDEFPEYDNLLKISQGNGIDCYTLNLLIESCERREDNVVYAFVGDDWNVVKTKEQEEAERKALHEERLDIYRKKKNELEAALASIRTRRVLIFFKATGRVGDMSYMNQLEKELDEVASYGSKYGTKGWAKQQRLDAIANSKPKPGENLITAAKLVAVIVLALTVSWVWVTSKRNMEIFNYKIESADQVLAQGKYVEARDAYYLAYEEYRPKITAMLAQSKMNKRVEMLETALNEEIEAGIAQINAMRVADNGRFSKVAEDLMFRLLELDPQNSSLLELKNEWMNQ